MPKRPYPDDINNQPAKLLKTERNGALKMWSASSESAFQKLYQGLKDLEKKTEQTIINSLCKCCNIVDNVCNYCDVKLCQSCIRTCYYCKNGFCENCSFCTYDQHEAVCYTCYK